MRRLFLTILAALCLAAVDAHAAWPQHPIKIVVPYPPGGPTDYLARMAAQGMQAELGESDIVENRPGASSIVGTTAEARAPADGYTVLLAPAAMSVNAAIRTDLPYDHHRDFIPVIELGRGEGIVAVNRKLDVHNLRELVALAKSSPEKYTVATAGTGTNTHMALVQFEQMAGVKLQHIPYKGAGQAVIDVISGNVPIMFGGITELKPQILNGKLRAIGILENARSLDFPSVPTADEQGFRGLRIYGYFGLMVKHGTPAEIVRKLNQAANQALKRPAAISGAHEAGLTLTGGSEETFAKIIAQTDQVYLKIVQSAGGNLE